MVQEGDAAASFGIRGLPLPSNSPLTRLRHGLLIDSKDRLILAPGFGFNLARITPTLLSDYWTFDLSCGCRIAAFLSRLISASHGRVSR